MSSPSLNERQRTILALVARGKSNNQIAEELHLSLNTIKWYLQGVFRELGASNRVQAVRQAREYGLLPLPLPATGARNNLPAATTPFLGREARIDDLRRLLLQPQPRLITLYGLGGAGKTRLAVEAARTVVGDFAGGVYFVPLNGAGTTDEIWERLLSALEVPGETMSAGRQLAWQLLQGKQVLLILDNADHLPALRRELSWLLTATRELKVLVTSRVALDLQAEQVYPLDGLAYRGGCDSPAYRLFVDAAQRRRPNFLPGASEAADIAAFCELVEGLPLAIELGASWNEVMSPGQLIGWLHESLGRIVHDVPDRPARQRSLWAVFDYSWRLLNEEERCAAMRLHPLRGSFSREAALAIAGCSPAVFKRLLHSSLVRSTADGRLAIHELVRQFLEEQAASAALDPEELGDRHMTYYLGWLSEQGRALRQTMLAPIVQSIAAEWHHLEQSWWRAVERGRYDLLEGCIDLVMYFEARGMWGEGQAFFKRTREAVPPACPDVRARLDEALSVLAIRMYDLSSAEQLATRALAVLALDRSATCEVGLYARVTLCTAAHTKRDYEAYAEFVEELAHETDAHFDSFSRIMPLMFEGINCCRSRAYQVGVQRFREIIAISDERGYHIPAIQCMLGLSYLGLREHELAREQFSRALTRAREIAVYPALVSATYELDRLAYPQGTPGHRQQVLVELAQEMGSVPTVGRVAIHVGANHMSFGFFGKGRQLLRVGLGLLWGNVSATEMARNTLIAAKLFAYGVSMIPRD